ncbi:MULTISPECIES: CRISPR-associated endonuclease Cas1 [Microbulbifer]|nr:MULTISPECIES: CRISPR-associated endonuclease Cas1 [Microbulbifer]
MATLYLDHPGATLQYADRRLKILCPENAVESLPLGSLERLVLTSRCQLDTGLLLQLAQRGIALSVLSPGVRKVALFQAHTHGDARRRYSQVVCCHQSQVRRRLAALLVARKLRQQAALLRSVARECPAHARVCAQTAERLQACAGRLAGRPPRLARLRGLEGAAAAAFYRSYRLLFAPSLGFHGRNHRPPRDPVNAVLSLAFVLLTHEAAIALATAGLDSAIGFYHGMGYRRPALACDLAELFRQRVAHWVWQLFRDRTLRREHFQHTERTCLLGKAGKQAFYRAWERGKPQLRQRLQREAARWASQFSVLHRRFANDAED